MPFANFKEPATPSAVIALRAKYPGLPPAYFELLTESNGIEAELAISWVRVFPAEEALVATNQYQVSIYRPDYFAFGSDGAGELLVCSLTGQDPRPLYFLPAIGMADGELMPLATSFETLREELGKLRSTAA